MAIYLSLLISLLGLLAYAMAGSPKAQEAGRLAYFAGLLAFLITIVPKLVEVLR